ncbi:MAG: FAD-dependent oxidoreductase [Verrucomicrobiota bacterium]
MEERNTSLKRKCDVLVVGGGVAGLPAAVAAARAGASTVLVERNAFLGGAGILALHRYICGLYLGGPTPPKEPLNGGLVREIVAGLAQLFPGCYPVQLGRVWGFPFQPAHLRDVYTRLAAREKNLSILESSELTSIDRQSTRVGTVVLESPGGPVEVTPRAVIDCTGDGTAIRLAKAPFELAPEHKRQLGGCTIHIDGIEGEREVLGIKIAWRLSRLAGDQAKGLPPFAGFAAGAGEHDGFCKFSITPELAHRGEFELGDLITRTHALLTEQVPELKRSVIVTRSPCVMDREGLRIKGQWRLDEESVLQARKFPDGVVRNAWPIEFWSPESNSPVYRYIPDGDYYEIPRRCLRSASVENLFAGGRCISGSSEAIASTRAMGTCMAIGEAVGKEAAAFAQNA